jgi:hypothetical protein
MSDTDDQENQHNLKERGPTGGPSVTSALTALVTKNMFNRLLIRY